MQGGGEMAKVAVAFGLVVLLFVPMTAAAAPLSAVLTDPTGDTLFKAPGFLDVVRAEVTRDGSTFAAGVASGPTGNRRSARKRSAARLVVKTASRGQPSSSSASQGRKRLMPPAV